MSTGKPEKAGACWRGSAKDKGFAEKSAPTWALANRKKPGRVGVARRRTKALRRSRRQQRRRQIGKSRGVLAWLDEGQRLCGESTPTWAQVNRKKPRRVGAARRRVKALRRDQRQQGHRQAWEIRTMLADWEKPGRVGVNRRRAKKNTEQLNHCSVEVTFFLHQHHLTKNYPDITSADGSSPAGSPRTPSSPGSSTCSSGESAGSTSASPAFPYR